MVRAATRPGSLRSVGAWSTASVVGVAAHMLCADGARRRASGASRFSCTRSTTPAARGRGDLRRARARARARGGRGAGRRGACSASRASRPTPIFLGRLGWTDGSRSCRIWARPVVAAAARTRRRADSTSDGRRGGRLARTTSCATRGTCAGATATRRGRYVTRRLGRRLRGRLAVEADRGSRTIAVHRRPGRADAGGAAACCAARLRAARSPARCSRCPRPAAARVLRRAGFVADAR